MGAVNQGTFVSACFPIVSKAQNAGRRGCLNLHSLHISAWAGNTCQLGYMLQLGQPSPCPCHGLSITDDI